MNYTTKSRSPMYDIGKAIFFVLILYGSADYIYDLIFGNDANIMVSFKPLMYYFLAIGSVLVFLCFILAFILLYVFLSASVDNPMDSRNTDANKNTKK